MQVDIGQGKYYLYKHVRLDKNQVFYVGIGTIKKKITHLSIKTNRYKRAYEKSNRNKYWKNIVNKTNYKVEILLESDNLDFIKTKEIEFIKLYGRRDLKQGTLVNLTDGGDGGNRQPKSKKWREVMASRKGLKFSEETKLKMRDSKKRAKKDIDNKDKYKYDEKIGLRTLLKLKK